MISQKNSLYIGIKFALEKLVCQPPKYIYIYMYVCVCMYVYKIQRYFDFKNRKEKICRARKNYKDKYDILFLKKIKQTNRSIMVLLAVTCNRLIRTRIKLY